MYGPDGENYSSSFQIVSGRVTVPVGTSQLLPADPNRLVLLVYYNAGGSGGSLGIGGSGLDSWVFVPSANTLFELTWQRHGPICQQSIWGVAVGLSFALNYTTLIRR